MFWVEDHMKKYGQEGFCSPCVAPRHQCENVTQLVQMIFSAWRGYFEYGSVSCVVRCWSFYINVLIGFLSALAGLHNVEHCPARSLHHGLRRLPLTFHQLQHHPALWTNQFLHFSSIFTFHGITKYSMPKMLLFSSIFDIKIANVQILIFF